MIHLLLPGHRDTLFLLPPPIQRYVLQSSRP